MPLNTLEDLLHEELKDLYSAETQLTKALPKMAKAAKTDVLKKGFETHLEETRGQVERLDQIGKLLGVKLKGKTCKAMEGLIAEGAEIIQEKEAEPAVRDGALIAAAQRVEHYEISGYGTARALAEHLKLKEVAKLLQETLDEESATNEKLTRVAEDAVYPAIPA